MMSFISMVWKSWLYLLGLGFIMPLLMNLLISALTSQTVTLIVKRYGLRAQSYWGCLGIVVHEGSHALLALLFLHHIDQIKLFVAPKAAITTTQLGYVAHSYHPHNLYQRLGNFFIGQAPFMGIIACMMLVTKWFWPQLFSPNLNFTVVTAGFTWWHFLLWLVMIISLSLGLNLSRADWHNTWSGSFLYVGLLMLVALFLTLVNPSFYLTYGLDWLVTVGGFYLILFSLALLVNLIVVLLTKAF